MRCAALHQSSAQTAPQGLRLCVFCGSYHYPGDRTLNRMPDREKTAGTPESRAKVEALVKESGAQLWIGHDIVGFAKLKKSPAFYE